MYNSEKTASALANVREITKDTQTYIIRSEQISRSDRELLIRTKWLQPIIKGWYLLVKPDVATGESMVWYANFWDFLKVYLSHYFEDEYCLSAENSIDLHTASSIIPRQVIVISKKGKGAPQELPFDTSVYIYKDIKGIPEEKTNIRGLKVMSLPYALCKVSTSYFQKNPKEAEIALTLIQDYAELAQVIIKYNFISAAERLIGAYNFIGDKEMAKNLSSTLLNFGLKIKEANPFSEHMTTFTTTRVKSPYVARVNYYWNNFRDKVISCFPKPSPLPKDPNEYFTRLEDLYDKDAYNSLSIEGYNVDEHLIERVKGNLWNSDIHQEDFNERNALAARGYYEAFQEVKKSILKIFNGENPGVVIEHDLKIWYQSLFSPLAKAGVVQVNDLIGYRKGQVYIRNSRHVPLPKDALMDAMDTLFDCIKKEEHPAVRAVLGHYIFVYIHPYMDGNGRFARFLMNTLFSTGGYPWTIIQVKNRKQYMQSLETIGVECNIEPFAKFIFQEMQS